MKGPYVAFSLVAVASSLLFSREGRAADGWQGAHWGETEGMVMRTFPQLQAMSAEDQKSGSLDGQVCKLTMPYDAGTRKFRAVFCFDKATELRIVILDVVSPIDSRSLRDDLTSKYGKPAHEDYTVPIVTSTSWRDGDTIIELVVHRAPHAENFAPDGVGYSDEHISVFYSATEFANNKGL